MYRFLYTRICARLGLSRATSGSCWVISQKCASRTSRKKPLSYTGNWFAASSGTKSVLQPRLKPFLPTLPEPQSVPCPPPRWGHHRLLRQTLPKRLSFVCCLTPTSLKVKPTVLTTKSRRRPKQRRRRPLRYFTR